MSLKEILALARKGWIVIVGVVVIFTIVALGASKVLFSPEYQVNAKLFVGESGVSDVYRWDQTSNISKYQQVLENYQTLILSNSIISKSLEELNLPSTYKDVEKVKMGLETHYYTESRTISVKFKTSEKAQAAQILNKILNNFAVSKFKINNGYIEIAKQAQTPRMLYKPNYLLAGVVGAGCGLAFSLGILAFFEGFKMVKKK
ncbi:MAG: Wzz/FepE/Etk N-terminal domain-containing protein [Sarcina sp.]